MKFLVAISALVSLATTAELADGNWAYTCKDEELDGFTLKAKCKDIAGDYLDTSIDLKTCLAWSTTETNIVKQDGGNLSIDCSDCWLSVSSTRVVVTSFTNSLATALDLATRIGPISRSSGTTGMASLPVREVIPALREIWPIPTGHIAFFWAVGCKISASYLEGMG
ncbi:hypothetical protein EDB81DRAFT_906544 [Dactylonectria macrodidyma]|uniref:Cyanovirin-N domain-containing protein n=1 Tax=Dactylonectria macrodidyma TaxID=307937 RepID=A0A9P9IQ26_9HYPO|nr:hypothetical protein EDB81DRAFT_906544 [Dactylonectria macrodidyma]